MRGEADLNEFTKVSPKNKELDTCVRIKLNFILACTRDLIWFSHEPFEILVNEN